jgi:hypothetical protein
MIFLSSRLPVDISGANQATTDLVAARPLDLPRQPGVAHRLVVGLSEFEPPGDGIAAGEAQLVQS